MPKERVSLEKMAAQKRKTVTKALEELFPTDKAKKYEKAIYDMVLNGPNPSDATYIRVAYEKLGHFKKVLEEKGDVKTVLKDIDDGVTSYESSVYSTQKVAYEKALSQALQKPKATKGVYVCKNMTVTSDGKQKPCGSDSFYVWSLQTRSGDEGTTVYRQCEKCGKRGKEG
jgi:DNA-directed RNA polymerase subunit M/transcription elongation factor TFIIS